MAVLELDEHAAFDLLGWHCSHLNVKLRDVAAVVVAQRAELTHPDSASTPRERLRAAITGVAPIREPALTAARSVSSRPADINADEETTRTNRIPPWALPGIMVRAVAGAAQSISIADYTATGQPLVYVNRAFEVLTGYPAQEILGRNCRFLQGPEPVAESEAAAVAELRRAIAERRESRTVLRNYRRDRTAFWNELHLSAVRDAAGTVSHYIGYETDVSERIERDRQLEHLAFHDARTNLPNQAAAAAYLRGRAAADDNSDEVMVLVRLSGFRSTDGRSDDPAVIRTVLATAAERLQAAVPPPAYLAELDDDTFLVVTADASAHDAVAAAAQALEKLITVDGGHIQLHVQVESTGAAELATLTEATPRR